VRLAEKGPGDARESMGRVASRRTDLGRAHGGGDAEERALAVAFKRGDRDAYRAVHDRYAPRVHRAQRRIPTT
jgi:hypothetical protein